MRRTSSGLRVASATCRLLTLILGLTLAATAHAQGPSTKKAAAPPPLDTRPLARFAPGDRLVVYAEYLGVDALDAAWQKTNASKMLNTTTLGAMLEELGAQLVDKVLHHGAPSKTPGVEVVAMARHILHSGFVFAGSTAGPDGKGSCAALVIRGGARRDVAGMFARLLLSFGKYKVVKKSGRDVVVMPGSSPGAPGWAWWAEKEDLVVALDRPESADVVIEVLDGKRANAVNHPTRTELIKAEDGMQPALVAFLDATAVGQADPKLPSTALAAKVQSYGIKRVDYRWGFQDNALMSVLRLIAPKPRQGLLALIDGPTFDRTSLPPLPAGIDGFGVVSLQPAKVYDELMTQVKAAGPDSEAKLKAAIESFETQARVKLRSAVLAHLGPKIAFYVPPVVGRSVAVVPGTAVLPGPLAMMVGLLPRSPRFAFVAEIDNPTVVGKSLDDLMLWVNGQFKAQAAAAPKPPPAAGAAAASEDDEDEGPPPAPEFERMPGTAKAYTLLMPSGMGKLPGNVRPSVRVGTSYLAIASSPEVAKMALDIKSIDLWKPPADLAPAFARLPTGLIGLGVGDPRETLSKALASLPGTLQSTINTAILTSPPPGGPPMPPGGAPMPTPGAPPSAMPGAPGANPAPATIVLQVSPSKLPSADALKALLFPGTLAVAVDDQGLRVVRRQAFPNISMEGGTMSALLMPAIQAARKAAAKNAGGPGAVPKPGTTTAPAPVRGAR